MINLIQRAAIALLVLGIFVLLGAPNTTQPNLINMTLSQCTLNQWIMGTGAGAVPKCAVTHTTGDATVVIASGTNIELTTTNLTASRAWTLPTAAAYGQGNHLWISDVAGAINGANTIVVTRASADTINGATTATLASQYAFIELVSDGTSKWNFAAAGSGTVTSVTPGNGLVSSITASCSQSAITTSGTLSGAMCVDARTSTTEAITDSDRAKIVTFSNASATAVSIAQAGASSAFQSGWFTWVRNLNTGLVTITPATSTIDASTTFTLRRGDFVAIVSDGTNYQVMSSRQCCTHLSQVFTSSGTYTPGPGIYFVRGQAWGPGGGSGGTDASHGGAGGGGGGYCEDTVAVVPGSGVTVTVGTGGTAGSATGPTAGGNGSSATSFGSSLVATAGGGSAAATGGIAGGAAGVCSTGAIKVSGSAGGQNNYIANGGGATAAGPGGGAYGTPITPAVTSGSGVEPGGGAPGQILFGNAGFAGGNGRVIVWD